MSHSTASQPLTERYASAEMSRIFSPDAKFSTWRRLWLALAEAQKELGLEITDTQIEQIRVHVDDINYADAERREKEIRHDVMAHVYALGLQAKAARPIIHLGATSAYVTDNTDILLMRDALRLLRGRVLSIIASLRAFAQRWRDTPTLAFTHLQPAQLTTVGKRATLWLYDLVLDHEDLLHREQRLALLGVKGATGTQASFLQLFNGDASKVHKLEELVAQKLGLPRVVPVSGQTYSRKFDAQVVDALAGFAQSASKFAYDIRLLQHMREIEEPFEQEQVGSSAMAYKRNPMRCERIDGIARHLIINSQNPAHTAATQWLERTLDDSANRRIAIPEAFLAADAIAILYLNVAGGMVVHEDVIAANVKRELPYMATENLMMEGVRRGGDRQSLHERIRLHSMAASDALKRGASENDLLDRIAKDELVPLDRAAIDRLVVPQAFIGLAPEQVDRFLLEVINPLLDRERSMLELSSEEVRV